MTLSRNASLLSRVYQAQNQRIADRLPATLKKEQKRISKEYPALLRSVVYKLSKVDDVPSARVLRELGGRALFIPAVTPEQVSRRDSALSAYYGMLSEVQTTVGGIADRVSCLGSTLDTEDQRKAELKVADAVEKYLIVKQVAAKLTNLRDAMSVDTPANDACRASAEVIKAELQPIIDAHDNLKSRYLKIQSEIMTSTEIAEGIGVDPEQALTRKAVDGVRAALAKCKGDDGMQQLNLAVSADLHGPEFQSAILVAMVKTMGARARDLKHAVARGVEAIGSASYRRKGDGGKYGNRSSRRPEVSKANKKAWKVADAARSKYELAREALLASVQGLDDPRLHKPAPAIGELVRNHPDSLEELYDEGIARMSSTDSFERVAMREFNKLRSMQLGSRTLCESHVNQAHAYAMLANNNIVLAKGALRSKVLSTEGDDGICRGPSEAAFAELHIAMRGKPTDGVPKMLTEAALEGCAAMQFQEAERNLARAHAALACAKPTILWHYSTVAPGINPACSADPLDHRDARAEILNVLGIVAAEVAELMVLMPYAALNAVACADLLAEGSAAADMELDHEGLFEDDLLGNEIDEHDGEGVDANAVGGGFDDSATADVLGAGGAVGGGADLLAEGSAAADMQQDHEDLSEDDLLGDEIDEHYGEGVDANAVGGGFDNSATADVLGAGGAVGGGAADGNIGGATVECDVPQPIHDDKANDGDRRAANRAGRAALRAATSKVDFDELLFQSAPDSDESSGDEDLQPAFD
jgi:hypothetical protein